VSLFINDKALACVASTRYLGVVVDQHLTWKLHVDCVKEDKIYVVCIKLNETAPRSFIMSVISIFCFAHF